MSVLSEWFVGRPWKMKGLDVHAQDWERGFDRNGKVQVRAREGAGTAELRHDRQPKTAHKRLP